MRRIEHRPGIELERAWWSAGTSLVAGLDEAGRGAWAGPVVAAAVILPACSQIPSSLADVADSKLLAPAMRERLFDIIGAEALAYGIGSTPADEIDRIGIVAATRLAMMAALRGLTPQPQALLIDALTLPLVECPQQAIIKGDRLCLSIAAASILAKVTRDRWMRAADIRFPGYALAKHKGYGTAEHHTALRAQGPSPIHRLSYAPVACIARSLPPKEDAQRE